MKKILIFLLFSFIILNVSTKNNVKHEYYNEIKNSTTYNNQISIKLIDNVTLESLPGVKCGNKYSDLNGVLKINKGDIITLNFISYQKILLCNIKNDTIIKMTNNIK